MNHWISHLFWERLIVTIWIAKITWETRVYICCCISYLKHLISLGYSLNSCTKFVIHDITLLNNHCIKKFRKQKIEEPTSSHSFSFNQKSLNIDLFATNLFYFLYDWLNLIIIKRFWGNNSKIQVLLVESLLLPEGIVPLCAFLICCESEVLTHCLLHLILYR